MAVVHTELRGQLQTLPVRHDGLHQQALAPVHLSQPLRGRMVRRYGIWRMSRSRCEGKKFTEAARWDKNKKK